MTSSEDVMFGKPNVEMTILNYCVLCFSMYGTNYSIFLVLYLLILQPNVVLIENVNLTVEK